MFLACNFPEKNTLNLVTSNFDFTHNFDLYILPWKHYIEFVYLKLWLDLPNVPHIENVISFVVLKPPNHAVLNIETGHWWQRLFLTNCLANYVSCSRVSPPGIECCAVERTPRLGWPWRQQIFPVDIFIFLKFDFRNFLAWTRRGDKVENFEDAPQA